MNGDPASGSGATGAATVLRLTLVVVAVVAFALLAWQLSDVLLLAFGAVLFAIVLHSLADTIDKHTPVGPPWGLVIAGLLIAAVVGAFAYLLGSQIHAQVSGLLDRLPELLSNLGDRVGIDNLRERLAERVENFSERQGIVSRIVGYTSTLVDTLANLLLAVAAGVYLAARPRRYRDGLLKLVPGRRRAQAARAFDSVGRALRLWLLGQLVSMAFVGVLITAGLYAIGMPSALALGFLAGVSEFVPLVGPLVSAVPAILLAVSEGGNMALWVIGLYVVVQQIEGNLIMPLVQRRAVDLPPVVTLFAILSLGILFGTMGILLGAPLTVALYVAVKQLYVRDLLGAETDVPGERR